MSYNYKDHVHTKHEVTAIQLAEIYADHPLAIAKLCDEHIDRRGSLLGVVREINRAKKGATP